MLYVHKYCFYYNNYLRHRIRPAFQKLNKNRPQITGISHITLALSNKTRAQKCSIRILSLNKKRNPKIL